jgi:REP element-mobilizing transposase RayT
VNTKFDPQKHHRRSIRLKGYDYASEGAYYVTIITQNRECLFGEIIDGEIHLTKYGEIVEKGWIEISIHFPNVETGTFIVMPNHVHGIILIRGKVISPNYQGNDILCKPSLGQIIAYFKYQSTKEMNAMEHTGTITKFWQRNYYEHIIRNDKELRQKTDYILDNPSRWDRDQENPNNKKPPSSS